MPLSNKKRRERRKFRAFRRRNKIFHCKKCGKKLNSETHHFYCNQCHTLRKNQNK